MRVGSGQGMDLALLETSPGAPFLGELLKANRYFVSLKNRAGVVQWQYRSFPSFGRGFDSHRPLQTTC
jgi:hypothetical protein